MVAFKETGLKSACDIVIYEEDDVEEESEFTNYDGSISEVTMLCSDEEGYIEDDFYTGFVKNYKGGKYAFMALLPKKKKAKTFWKRLVQPFCVFVKIGAKTMN